jgi:hypothetical protein
MENTATSIIKSLGLDPSTMTPEAQQELLGKVGTLIYQAVLLRVMEVLADDTVTEFEKLVDSGADQDAIFTFLKSHVPNLEEIIKEESEKFKQESLHMLGEMPQA